MASGITSAEPQIRLLGVGICYLVLQWVINCGCLSTVVMAIFQFSVVVIQDLS